MSDVTSLTKKQRHIALKYQREKPKILVLYGAVRSGKSYLAVFLFLCLIIANANRGEKYIIGGVSKSTIQRNILDPIEEMTGVPITLRQDNSFQLHGNTVYAFRGEDKSAWKKARGFEAKAALINEATALHKSFLIEVINRCSAADSRIIFDTNPENPQNYVNTQLIKKKGTTLKSGRKHIDAHHFSIFDNETLDPEYIEGLIASTPSGMHTERNIYGRWVAAEGAVYVDFNAENMCDLEELQAQEFVRKFAGVDWGYKHKGAMCVWGVTKEGIRYRLEEHAARYQDITYWTTIARSIKARHGNIPFYCGVERPEYIHKLSQAGIVAIGAVNNVLPGIAFLASLYKTNHIIIPKEDSISGHYFEEIYEYVWSDKGKDEPMKENDDMMDADRYAIATDAVMQERGSQTNQEKLNMLANYGL